MLRPIVTVNTAATTLCCRFTARKPKPGRYLVFQHGLLLHDCVRARRMARVTTVCAIADRLRLPAVSNYLDSCLYRCCTTPVSAQVEVSSKTSGISEASSDKIHRASSKSKQKKQNSRSVLARVSAAVTPRVLDTRARREQPPRHSDHRSSSITSDRPHHFVSLTHR